MARVSLAGLCRAAATQNWSLSDFLNSFYLYFRSLTNQEFDWRQTWHLLPGLGQGLARPLAALYDLGWLSGVQHRPLPYHFGTLGPAAKALDALQTPLGWLGLAILLLYGVRVLRDYQRYRHYLDANFSNTERLRFAGLQQLLVVQAAVLALNLLFLGLDAALDFSYNAAWNFYVAQGLLIYGLLVVGLQANYAAASSPLLFEAVRLPSLASSEPLALAPEPIADLEPFTRAASAPEEATALPADLWPWRAKLLTLMATERPWLEPELTLGELAQRLHTHAGLLSKVINAGCKQNFNDFVNTYRVQEAQRKLADPRYAHYSLVGVALESGFNSKSTFNRVFKKLVGQTPSQVPRPKS